MMKVLGIECTAHTFGASVVDGSGRFLSNEKASFTSSGKGMVPREVLEFHRKHRDGILEKALEPTSGKIDAIAVSQGPGIGTLLHEGIEYSKGLSEKRGIPLFGVNHAVAHFEIGIKECNALDPVFLYVSGGNTQILVRETAGKGMAAGGHGENDGRRGIKDRHENKGNTRDGTQPQARYRVVGETLDIGLGNLLDKSARVLGLGFPGGPLLYDLSLKSMKFIDLPYSIKGMDVCFSGLATAFKNKAEAITQQAARQTADEGGRKATAAKNQDAAYEDKNTTWLTQMPGAKAKKGEAANQGAADEGKSAIKTAATGKTEKAALSAIAGKQNAQAAADADFTSADLAFSLQEVAFDIVCEASERALAHFGKDELVLAGGVACSKVLQQKAKSMCEERGAKLLVPSNAFLTDNAAMIAYNGFQLLKAGAEPLEKDAKALPHWRPDEVDIVWA